LAVDRRQSAVGKDTDNSKLITENLSSFTSRCFAFGSQKTFVYYALFDGGEVVDVENPLTARFKKVFLDSLNPKKSKGAKPKFYVRFTSNEKPIEWWLEQEEFRELMEAIYEMTARKRLEAR